MSLNAVPGSFDGLFPRTHCFEINSFHTGARYAVWVTLPTTYAAEPERHYATIYEPDGNIGFPQSAALDAMLYIDPIAPISPFIKVSIGYAPSEAQHFSALRNRDLVPPGDPVGEVMRDALTGMNQAGYIGADTVAIGRAMDLRGGADLFLAFIEDELHPALLDRYRIDTNRIGLWGYSLGGLFSTYAALTYHPMFAAIGAGSPAILGGQSVVFDLYRALLAAETHHDRRFHLTVSLKELTAPSFYQLLVGAGTAELLLLAGQQPLPNFHMTTETFAQESHATAFPSSWFSFLRFCYPSR